MTLAKINSLKQNFDATRIMFQSDPIDMGSMGQYYSDDNWVSDSNQLFPSFLVESATID